MKTLLGLLSGKKTYAVSAVIVAQAVLPALLAILYGQPPVEALKLVDWRTVLEGLGLSTLRAAITKAG